MKYNKTLKILSNIAFTVLIFNFILSTFNSFSQGGAAINSTGGAADNSAMLDVSSSNQGVRIPRVALTSTTSSAPITNPVNSLLVYDSVTAGDVTPGFYYWDGTASKWIRFSTGSGGSWSTSGNSGIDTTTNFIGTTDDRSWVMKTNNTQRMKISKTGSVVIGASNPASSAILDVNSTTKGQLIPRMTTSDRDAIASPATGLQIFNTDCNGVNYWNGTCWLSSMTGSLRDPGLITTDVTAFCLGTSHNYSILAVPTATNYVWTVPAGASVTSGQGTTSATVLFGNNASSGDVCVRAYNACEVSPTSCISVRVGAAPTTPGSIGASITAATVLYPGLPTKCIYSVAPVPDAVSYNWTLPTGFSIVSGAGTTDILVQYLCNAMSGTISVKAQSSCGTVSNPSSLSVTMSPVLLAVTQPSPLYPTYSIGGNATGGYSTKTYAWSPNDGGLSSYTAANPTASCLTATNTIYIVTVTDVYGCTATNSASVTRTYADAGPAAVPGRIIGGSPTATGGDGDTYTYSWTITTGLSSATVANPQALCGDTTTTYVVKVTDAHSCTATSSVVVTKNFVANAGTDQTAFCAYLNGSATGGTTPYSYLWSPITGLSNAAIANPLANTSQTYVLTVTDANNCTSTASMIYTLVAASYTDTLTYTGSAQTWVLPATVNTCVNIEVWGAEGGKGWSTAAVGTTGKGGYSYGTITSNLTIGEVFNIYIGQKGTDAASSTAGVGGSNSGGGAEGGNGGTIPATTYAGGGGGGATDIRRGGIALSNRIIIGGGGGGVGRGSGTGGQGGGNINDGTGTVSTVNGGKGTSTAGGGGATSTAYGVGLPGTLGAGGAAYSGSSGAGGGGGYYGGGGGTSTTTSTGGLGGGGSAYNALDQTKGGTNNNRTGNGQVVIRW